MSLNEQNMYDLETHIAEVYDRFETQTEDIEFIRKGIAAFGRLRILEPFCGTGRILIPLALDGHELVGLDQSKSMLARARMKIGQLPPDVQARIRLIEEDAIADDWPAGFDLVILAGNCFYELATPEEQEGTIRAAAQSLKPGGLIYIDNDHMEGGLDPTWQEPGVSMAFPTAICEDGTRLSSSLETVWFDASRRLVRIRRRIQVRRADQSTFEREYIQQKHPVSAMEVQTWLETHGFQIEGRFGDHGGSDYSDDAPRAIFWARK
jgi:SAM-dependent methyltransferase